MMKKIFTLLFISVSVLNYGQSNQILDFKSGYTPETIYKQITTNSSDYEILYSGSEKFLEILEKNGTENPTKIKNLFNVETLSKTGKINKDGNFPITIEYVKTSDGNGKVIIPSGSMLFGKTALYNMPQMDSIVAKDMDENLKNTLFQTVQSTFSQLVMPQKKLKIGESFDQESPLSIPLAGITIDMVIKTTYTLKSINSKDAFFDISQTYTIKMSNNKFDTKGTGTGKGNLIYNISNHFITENTLAMEFILNLKQTDFGLELKSKSDFKQTAIISKG